MAKQYHRRDSGLLVADDSLVVPKPDISRPWGMGSRAPLSAKAGNVQFNDGKVLFTDNGVAMSPDCCCEEDVECHNCSGSGANAPAVFKVVVGSISGDSCCTAYNGTYYVPVIWLGAGNCVWKLIASSPPECGTSLQVQVRIGAKYYDWEPASSSRIFVELLDADYDVRIEWFYSFGETKPDCLSFNNFSVPFLVDLGSTCSAASSTALVTAA